MQECLDLIKQAKNSKATQQKIIEALLYIQKNLHKSIISSPEKDIEINLTTIWNFYFEMIKNTSFSIQNSVERSSEIFLMRNYSFFPNIFNKLLTSQLSKRKTISSNSTESKNQNSDELKNPNSSDLSVKTDTKIQYDPNYSKYDNLILTLFTFISLKIPKMKLDNFLKENQDIFTIFTMKGNSILNTTVPQFISELKYLGVKWHSQLLIEFMKENPEFSQIKSIASIINNYPELFPFVFSSNFYSLISFIISTHSTNFECKYFSNLNNFPRTDDLINHLFESNVVSEIDNLLTILSCDKNVKATFENENFVQISSTNNFYKDIPLSKIIDHSSFYNFSNIPFKYLIPKENDSVLILSVKFQKLAQCATVMNSEKVFNIFNHFLNERENCNYCLYDDKTSSCLQNLPLCINVFSNLNQFPLFLKKILLIEPISWLHSYDISLILGSLNSVHFNLIGGLASVIKKLFKFSLSSNIQLSTNAIESIIKITIIMIKN